MIIKSLDHLRLISNKIADNVSEKDCILLIGEIGVGKTTLLKVIAGLIEPTTGTIRVRGKEIVGPGPDRALVFQDFALLPWATVCLLYTSPSPRD